MSSRRSILKSTIMAMGAFRSSGKYVGYAQPDLSTSAMWDRTVSRLLNDELWLDSYAYDAGHALMIPLHAAFQPEFSATGWIEEFVDFFARLDGALDRGVTLPENLTTKQQFLYLVTQWAILLNQAGHSELINERLIDTVVTEQKAIWQESPAWQWERDDFPTMRDRVSWKLSTTEVDRSYYRAIIDEELFNFALAADLTSLLGTSISGAALSALEMADQVMASESRFTGDGGWLLQPGVYWQHPDYAYAGYDVPASTMEPMPVRNLASDTSHAHRLPRILRSLQMASVEPDQVVKYEQMLEGFSRQFFTTVLVHPDQSFAGYRTTNFLDGSNGLYRWGYETQGVNNGYLPYELSGTILFGWWAFLGNSQIGNLYNSIASTFPLADNVVKTYTGPNTSRERHPLLQIPDFYTNGLAEFTAILASNIRVLA